MTHYVSALTESQAARVDEIEKLPADQRKEAAIALLRKTWNVQARHSIIKMFDVPFYEGHAAHPIVR